MRAFLILDIGGTKTTAVVFDDKGNPVSEFYVSASKTYDGENAVLSNTIELGNHALKMSGVDRSDIVGVGVAAPGPLDYRTGLLIDVPMMGWKNFPLGEKIKEEYGVPVYVENDGNLGALAEAKVGVAKGEECVLYQTISTGCGGGIVINGKIFHGHSGFAGEFGHVAVNFAGPRCGCGGSGCYELYASGTALNRRLKRDMEKGIKSLAFESIGYDSSKIEGKILSDAAEKGDDYALSMLRQEGYYIGVGLANLLNIFDPDAIVLAGGIVKASKWFWREMMDEIKRHVCFDIEDDRIRLSELNDKTIAYGAYCMVKENIDGEL